MYADVLLDFTVFDYFYTLKTLRLTEQNTFVTHESDKSEAGPSAVTMMKPSGREACQSFSSIINILLLLNYLTHINKKRDTPINQNGPRAVIPGKL